jgi:hypothetical protein
MMSAARIQSGGLSKMEPKDLGSSGREGIEEPVSINLFHLQVKHLRP